MKSKANKKLFLCWLCFFPYFHIVVVVVDLCGTVIPLRPFSSKATLMETCCNSNCNSSNTIFFFLPSFFCCCPLSLLVLLLLFPVGTSLFFFVPTLLVVVSNMVVDRAWDGSSCSCSCVTIVVVAAKVMGEGASFSSRGSTSFV